jgi:alditol oxidase
MAADRLWLSPQYGGDTIGIHFTWKRDQPAVERVLVDIEAALAPFAPRPHWGKVFGLEPDDVQRHYPRLPDFRALVERHDPNRKFGNAFLERYLG